MADPQRPWSNDEKNFLLAEIIKQQSPPPSVLYSVAANMRAQPQWDDMVVPPGRTVNQSRRAFDELARTQPPPQPPFVANPYGPQTPQSALLPGLKRPFQLEAPFAGRVIRPKPAAASGSVQQAPASEPPAKRKRGRPTKIQAQAKAAAEATAAAGRSEAGPAPRPSTPAHAQAQAAAQAVMPGPTIPTALAEEPRPIFQAPQRMQISAVLTPTNPKTASSSSSSSGKRRRGRSTRSDPEALGEVVGGPVQQYESPYARAAEGLEDTPARAAVMRHREEQSTQAQQAPRSGPAERIYGQSTGPPGPGPAPPPAPGSP